MDDRTVVWFMDYIRLVAYNSERLGQNVSYETVYDDYVLDQSYRQVFLIVTSVATSRPSVKMHILEGRIRHF